MGHLGVLPPLHFKTEEYLLLWDSGAYTLTSKNILEIISER